MTYPNLAQLLLQFHNDKDDYVHHFFTEDEFMFVFIEHLMEHFEKKKETFRILEPLLDPELEKEQQTVLSLNGTEVGELHLIFHSIFNESSLVYSSPSGLLHLYILDYDDFSKLKISNYIVLLHEFASAMKGIESIYRTHKKR